MQRSALRTAADRGAGPLVSLSPHVTVGASEWTGAEHSGSLIENGHAVSNETEHHQEDFAYAHHSAAVTDRHDRHHRIPARRRTSGYHRTCPC